MAFIYRPIKEKSFSSLEELKNAAQKEEAAIARIPVSGFLKHGAQFLDDEYFGDGNIAFKFNQNGIRSLTSFLGIRLDTLELLERQELASDVLNDLLAQRTIQDKLQAQELIINEKDNEIIGMVSKSYIGYSNHKLLQDIENLLHPKGRQATMFPENDNFVFQGGYSINTQLSLRYTMKKKVGVIKGRGGEGEDVTDLGFQFKNSMVGDSSVNINFFLRRRICANGLVVPAGSAVNRIIHSGKQESFFKRLENAFQEITRRIGLAGKMIEQLGALEFNPELLARRNRSDMIFDIIQGSKSEIVSECKIPNTSRGGNKKENKILREAAIIRCIPQMYARKYSRLVFDSQWRDNASMFDFINIFTEYAKGLNTIKKIETEEKAGVLADWIAKNKRKFDKTQKT